MRYRLLGALSCIALCACNGSDSRSDPESSGVLQGGFSGLAYRTPTRSGITDSTGTFKYLPGETVAFSVGEIRLGSAPGAAAMSLFTLAGLTPPTTEIAYRKELDLARRLATRFVRAANIQRLLMAVDADHDPSNGYDLRGAAAVLGRATIDLDLPLREFAVRLEKLAPGLAHNIPLSRPVVQLYRGLGLSVSGHGQTRSESLSDFGTLPTVEIRTYAGDGARQSIGLDYDGDENPDALDSWLFDGIGRITNISSRFMPWPGSLPVSRNLSYELDPLGALTGGDEESDENGDGLPDIGYRYDRENDGYGYPLSQTATLDVGFDGISDRRQDVHYTYDARHNVEGVATETDLNMDGTLDTRATYVASYDSSDRQLSGTQEIDLDGDGIVDERDLDTFDYGTPGVTVYEYLADADADGIAELRFRITTHKDVAGNVTSHEEEYDYGNDGLVEARLRVAATYDSQHRQLTRQFDQDHDGDGIFDSRQTDTTTYDDAGNPSTANSDFDSGVDGTIEATYAESWQYGTGGELLGGRYDFFAPGNPEPSWGGGTVVTQTPFQDAVLLLAQEYIDWNVGAASL